MRFKINTFFMILAVVLCMTAFSFPAYANISTDEELSVNDSVESNTPLTPSGNLTTIDDIHQVTDTSNTDEVEDKQFITVQSKNGNTFYIIIDRSGDTDNVYFLNAVDETDLLALIEDEELPTLPATCTCTTKCELGEVNADCAVCSKDKEKCTATTVATEKPTEAPVKEQKSSTPIVGLVLLALLGGGGAIYWFMIKNKKSSTSGTTELDDLYEEDDDYEIEDEESEVEIDENELPQEQDYEVDDTESDTDESEEQH